MHTLILIFSFLLPIRPIKFKQVTFQKTKRKITLKIVTICWQVLKHNVFRNLNFALSEFLINLAKNWVRHVASLYMFLILILILTVYAA